MRSLPEPNLDFPFTEHDTPRLRARIQADLTHITHRIHAADPHAHTTILTGGFSRGEGTAIHHTPLNDYDLVIVRTRPGGNHHYHQLSQQLTQELNIEVDLHPIWRHRLPHVGRKLFWLDLRHGGRVLTGDPNTPHTIPPIHHLPPTEIARLLGNRAAGMLLSIPTHNEPPNPHQRDLQATKAILAAMDATLLTQGHYAPHMRQRLQLTTHHPHHTHYQTAVNWKLQPHHNLPTNYWQHARDTLLHAVQHTNAHHTHDTPTEHATHLLRARRLRANPSQTIRQRAWQILQRSTWPHGPEGDEANWTTIKREFFDARAKTLQ